MGVTGSASMSSGHQATQHKFKDVVIKVHPDKPPYSLQLLLGALKRRFGVAVSTHSHSSVKKLGSVVLQEDVVSRTSADLRITLIYSNVEKMTCTVGTSQIQGEENLLRYLCRFLDACDKPSKLYEDLDNITTAQIDAILDRLCDSSKHNISTLIPGIFNKSSFIAGMELTLADLLAYSLCKQHNVSNSKIQGWMQRVENSAEKI